MDIKVQSGGGDAKKAAEMLEQCIADVQKRNAEGKITAEEADLEINLLRETIDKLKTGTGAVTTSFGGQKTEIKFTTKTELVNSDQIHISKNVSTTYKNMTLDADAGYLFQKCAELGSKKTSAKWMNELMDSTSISEEFAKQLKAQLSEAGKYYKQLGRAGEEQLKILFKYDSLAEALDNYRNPKEKPGFFKKLFG